MKMRSPFLAAGLALACAWACAQQGPAPAPRGATSAPRATEPPPRTDRDMVRTPPPGVDPQAVETPPRRDADPGIDKGPPADTGKRTPPRTGTSREDDCRGPAELCKQDSAR